MRKELYYRALRMAAVSLGGDFSLTRVLWEYRCVHVLRSPKHCYAVCARPRVGVITVVGAVGDECEPDYSEVVWMEQRPDFSRVIRELRAKAEKMPASRNTGKENTGTKSSVCAGRRMS